MSRSLLLSLILLILFRPGAGNAQQSLHPHLNHIAIYVVDLKTATAFYRDIVGLDTIPEPFHDGRHTWFRVGPNSHLHLIQGAEKRKYTTRTAISASASTQSIPLLRF